MKKAIAEKWVKALRSKKYLQGKKLLKYKSPRGVVRHCCLGVLCELYQQDRRAKKMKPLKTGHFVPDGGDYDEGVPRNSKICEFDINYGTLPHRVMKWAGMRTDDGVFLADRVNFNDEIHTNLAALNDGGASFSEIADVIESNVKSL